jgi:motility quorum-sensing regulator/GCU-specific mRNA interferase toxin
MAGGTLRVLFCIGVTPAFFDAGADERQDAFETIKAAFADVTRLNRIMTAAEGAEDLGMDEQAVVHVIGGLTARDFDKSMPSEIDPAIWQDVYKPVIEGRELYVKFTLDAQGQLLLISFKENEP